jgi:ankyrin repeat protein
LVARALGFVLSSEPCPKVELSFPRVVPPDSDIAICIRGGDSLGLRELFATGTASPADIIAPYGWSTLCLALAYNRPEICELLIRCGAHQTNTPMRGRVADIMQFWTTYTLKQSPMDSAALLRDMVLLCAADNFLGGIQNDLLGPVVQRDPFSRLHKSVLGITCEPPIDLSRASRPYINDSDFLGRTALHWAACRDDLKLLEVLLHTGADPDIKDNDGKTALHLAAALGHDNLVRSLLASGAAIEAVECLGNTPIQVAAMQGQTEALRILIEAGANIESLNWLDETALMSACLAGEFQSVRLLYEYGADIHRLIWCRYNALGLAVKVNSSDIVEFLLEKGANTNILPLNGMTVLHLAAKVADARMLDILLAHEISVPEVDARDKTGYTPLEYWGLRKDSHVLEERFQQLIQHAKRQGVPDPILIAAEDAGDDSQDEFFDAEPFF